MKRGWIVLLPAAALALIAGLCGGEIAGRVRRSMDILFGGSGVVRVGTAERHRWLQEHPEELRVTAIGDFKSYAQWGFPILDGIRAAEADINASGILGARKLVVDCVESGGSGARLEMAMERVMGDPSCAALIGPISESVLKQYAGLVGAAGLLQIQPLIGDRRVLENNRHVFSTVESTSDYADSLADAILASGLDHLMVLADDDDDAAKASAEFANAAVQRGLDIDSLGRGDGKGSLGWIQQSIVDRFVNYGVEHAVLFGAASGDIVRPVLETVLQQGTNVQVFVASALPFESLDFVKGADRRRVFADFRPLCDLKSYCPLHEFASSVCRRSLWVYASAFARAGAGGRVPARGDVERELLKGDLQTPFGPFSFTSARFAVRTPFDFTSLADIDSMIRSGKHRACGGKR